MADRPPAPHRTDRFLIGIVAGAVLLIVAALAAVLVAGRAPRSAAADLSSPEGVTQAYVQALRAGDANRAYGLLSRSARASMSEQEYRRRVPRDSSSGPSEQRVLIEATKLDADTAEVKVTLSRFRARSEPFSAGSSHHDVTVRLVKEDGAWRIDQPVEPYSLAW